MTNANPDVTLTLSIDQVNQILDALGNRPFVEVYELIGQIQTQTQAQFPAQPPQSTGD